VLSDVASEVLRGSDPNLKGLDSELCSPQFLVERIDQFQVLDPLWRHGDNQGCAMTENRKCFVTVGDDSGDRAEQLAREFHLREINGFDVEVHEVVATASNAKVRDGSQPPMTFDLTPERNGWLPFAAPFCSQNLDWHIITFACRLARWRKLVGLDIVLAPLLWCDNPELSVFLEY